MFTLALAGLNLRRFTLRIIKELSRPFGNGLNLLSSHPGLFQVRLQGIAILGGLHPAKPPPVTLTENILADGRGPLCSQKHVDPALPAPCGYVLKH